MAYDEDDDCRVPFDEAAFAEALALLEPGRPPNPDLGGVLPVARLDLVEEA